MPLFRNPRVTLLIVMALLIAAVLVIVKKPPTLGLDLSGGTRLTLEAQPAKPGEPITPRSMEALYKIIQMRVDKMGVAETIVQRAGERRLIVEIPGEKDPEKAKARIGKTGLLEFRRQGKGADGSTTWVSTGVSGRDLESADVAPDDRHGGWAVAFKLNEGPQQSSVSSRKNWSFITSRWRFSLTTN